MKAVISKSVVEDVLLNNEGFQNIMTVKIFK